MLPAAGESSANAMRAAQRAAQNVRSPIPASRAIVPYAGGRLATQPMQQITTNMKVPGGRGGGGLTSAILMSLLEIFKPQIQSAVGSLYNSMGIGIGNLSDAKLKKQIEEELKMQKNINSMGIVGEDINGQSDRLSLLQQEANRRNIKGGAIKGGYGLKDESFKDAPKTQIMSDDKGRFFVGYKAMRNGKIQYVRGPEPGTGSSNPLEMLGRAINPNAYKQVDDISAKNKYQEASAGSISSLEARGASQLTLANRQSELKRYAPSAPSRPTPRVVYRQGAGTGGARTKSDLMGGATPKVPAFSASHSSGHSRSAKVLGIK